MIANSLSITIAQRTREFATLRTLGASRRQVRRLDRGRGARDRHARLGRRDRRRARARRGPLQAVRRRRVHAAEQRARLAHADGRRRADRRRSSSRSWQACAPPSARRACRRSPPCAKAPSCRRGGSTVPAGRLGAAHARRVRACSSSACSAAASRRSVLLSMGLGTLLIFFGVALLASRFVAAAGLGARLRRRASSAAPPARSPATTRGGTRSGRLPPRRR